MKINVFSFLCFVTISLLWSCQSTPPLPNEPKEVIRQWQSWINDNDFASAKKLSTPNTIVWIDWVEKMLIEDGSESESTPSNFQFIDCQFSGKKAICPCVVEELGQVYQDTFYLEQKQKQWLVDLPQEDLEYSTTLDSIFNIQ